MNFITHTSIIRIHIIGALFFIGKMFNVIGIFNAVLSMIVVCLVTAYSSVMVVEVSAYCDKLNDKRANKKMIDKELDKSKEKELGEEFDSEKMVKRSNIKRSGRKTSVEEETRDGNYLKINSTDPCIQNRGIHDCDFIKENKQAYKKPPCTSNKRAGNAGGFNNSHAFFHPKCMKQKDDSAENEFALKRPYKKDGLNCTKGCKNVKLGKLGVKTLCKKTKKLKVQFETKNRSISPMPSENYGIYDANKNNLLISVNLMEKQSAKEALNSKQKAESVNITGKLNQLHGTSDFIKKTNEKGNLKIKTPNSAQELNNRNPRRNDNLPEAVIPIPKNSKKHTFEMLVTKTLGKGANNLFFICNFIMDMLTLIVSLKISFNYSEEIFALDIKMILGIIFFSTFLIFEKEHRMAGLVETFIIVLFICVSLLEYFLKYSLLKSCFKNFVAQFFFPSVLSPTNFIHALHNIAFLIWAFYTQPITISNRKRQIYFFNTISSCVLTSIGIIKYATFKKTNNYFFTLPIINHFARTFDNCTTIAHIFESDK